MHLELGVSRVMGQKINTVKTEIIPKLPTIEMTYRIGTILPNIHRGGRDA